MQKQGNYHTGFQNLVAPTPGRLAFKVRNKAERMIRKQHPWIFENSITKQSADGKAGDLAIVYDQKKNKLMAIGLFDPYSPIRIKVLQFKQAAAIDHHWFQTKITNALALRKPLLQTNTNSYRLINGENDGLPAFICDVYAEVAVVKLYSPIWIPYLKTIINIIIDCTQSQAVVLRLSRNLQQLKQTLQSLHDGMILYGDLPKEEIIFKEHGLLFSANVIKGHKTGYFLDHRHNRRKIGKLAKDKIVLDIFAYAGGFSVHALAGGAKKVTSLDISNQALEMAKKNVALNFEEAPNHDVLAADAFEAMENFYLKKQTFDLVIVDPPSFAKRDAEVEKAIQAYARLTRLAINLVAPKGLLLMASCSSRVSRAQFFETILHALNQSGRSFNELERLFHDIDHPIGFEEGAYLKAGYYSFTN